MDSVLKSNAVPAAQQFSDALALRFKTLGGRLPTIVKRQAGLLARTLINLSAPQDKQKSAKRIEDRVNSKFHQMSDAEAARMEGDPEKAGHNGQVIWTGSHKFALYGVAADVDYRDASIEALEQLYLGRGGIRRTAGRAKYPRGHGQQDVYIWQKITTKRSTVDKLAKRMVERLGRLKAGWLVSWDTCGQPGRSVPQWIARHRHGARGSCVVEISSPNHPSVTIGNSARGVANLKKNNVADAALRIRAKALINDVRFAISNPKEWSEREAKSNASEVPE